MCFVIKQKSNEQFKMVTLSRCHIAKLIEPGDNNIFNQYVIKALTLSIKSYYRMNTSRLKCE